MADESQVRAGAGAPPDPEALGTSTAAVLSEISPATTVAAVELTVSDLARSLTYYRETVGLAILEQAAGRASLGVDSRELLRLVEERGARPAFGFTGLYHFALLVPERPDLARWLAHAARDHVPLVGLSDHFVSEALYLSDPDGHGIEIYWDRPREVWEGQVAARMTTMPLDVRGLLAELADPACEPFDRLAPGTLMGHIHLKVADVGETVAFYRDVLGFAVMAQLGPAAAFFGAGGYHHHIGANIWESARAPAPPPGSAALRQATIVLPGDLERDQVLARLEAAARPICDTDAGPSCEDPSGTALLLAVG